jgi:hypothetical protein
MIPKNIQYIFLLLVIILLFNYLFPLSQHLEKMSGNTEFTRYVEIGSGNCRSESVGLEFTLLPSRNNTLATDKQKYDKCFERCRDSNDCFGFSINKANRCRLFNKNITGVDPDDDTKKCFKME